jgi:hypothetical protein
MAGAVWQRRLSPSEPIAHLPDELVYTRLDEPRTQRQLRLDQGRWRFGAVTTSVALPRHALPAPISDASTINRGIIGSSLHTASAGRNTSTASHPGMSDTE